MAKRNKKIRETTIENFYDLRLDKIDELVAALKDEDNGGENISMNIADCTGESKEGMSERARNREFDPYKVDRFSRIPAWIKAIFIKFWFAGMVCYFVMMGLKIGNDLDRLVLVGAVLGVVVDVLVNPLFRYMESDRREYNAYMMFPFPFRAFWTFFTNLIYYIFVLVCVNFCYLGLNELLNLIKGTTEVIHLGVEPLLFGVITVACDMLFIGIKNVVVMLVKKYKKSDKGAVNV